MALQLFFVWLVSFVCTFLGAVTALRLFPRLGMMDRPWKYGHTRGAIPYYGGTVMFFSLFLSFLFSYFAFPELFASMTELYLREMIGFFVALVMLFIVSFLDDVFDVKAWVRLCVQVFAGGILVYSGIGIRSLTNPFGDPLIFDQYQFFVGGHEIFLLGGLFTIVWVVAMINTVNFLDGVPGLVSGVTFLASIALFLLSIRPENTIDQTPVMILSLLLAGISFGYMFFDFPPVKMLMGDSGSVFLGFSIAVLAILSGGKVATAFLVMGFPLLDAFFSIIRRILQGKSPFRGDLHHLHHRFLNAGFSERQVVLFLYGVSAFFGGSALFLGSRQKFFALLVLFVLMVTTVASIFFVAKRKQ